MPLCKLAEILIVRLAYFRAAAAATAESQEFPKLDLAAKVPQWSFPDRAYTGLTEMSSAIVEDPCQLVQFLFSLTAVSLAGSRRHSIPIVCGVQENPSMSGVGVGFEDGAFYYAFNPGNWDETQGSKGVQMKLTDPQNVFGLGI